MNPWQKNYDLLMRWLQYGEGQVIWCKELEFLKMYCKELAWQTGLVFATQDYPLSQITDKLCLLINLKEITVDEISSLNLDSNSIDIVILPHLLYCMKNPKHFIRTLLRVVRPGGYVIITGLGQCSWLHRQAKQSLPKLNSSAKLRYLLAKTGFIIINQQRFACYPLKRAWRRYLYYRLLANGFILLVQKRQYGLRKMPLFTRVRRWLTPTASVPTPSARVEHDKS